MNCAERVHVAYSRRWRRCANPATVGERCHAHQELKLTNQIPDPDHDVVWNTALEAAAEHLFDLGAAQLSPYIRDLKL